MGVSYAQDDELLVEDQGSVEYFEQVLVGFENGNANSAIAYFEGCLAGLVLVENDFYRFEDLDEVNAPLSEFTAASDRCLARIERTKNALKGYELETWPLREEMAIKTRNWLSIVKRLVTTYLIELSEPLSRSDDTWSDEDHDLYDRYAEEYEVYLVIDQDWVDFQYEFAEANDFEIEGIVELNTNHDNQTEEDQPTQVDTKADARNLSDGEVHEAVRYFDGVLGYILQIDAVFNGFITLDERDAPLTEFNAQINTCRTLILDLRKAMALYTKKEWAKKKEFDALTFKWIGTIESIVEKYIVKLAEPMSRPDNTWTEKELKFYDEKYLPAYDDYLKIDLEWVNFQAVFAEANDFTLGPVIE